MKVKVSSLITVFAVTLVILISTSCTKASRSSEEPERSSVVTKVITEEGHRWLVFYNRDYYNGGLHAEHSPQCPCGWFNKAR